jgi:hypothetical protein
MEKKKFEKIVNHADFIKQSDEFMSRVVRVSMMMLLGPGMEKGKEQEDMANDTATLLLDSMTQSLHLITYARDVIKVEQKLAVN